MKQIMVARQFPAYHPRAGEPTEFVEKILTSLKIECWLENPFLTYNDFEGAISENEIWKFSETIKSGFYAPKGHTMRAGKRWKTGDMAELKVWSGRPYNSKTITITPPLELTVFDVEIVHHIHPDYDTYEVLINSEHYCFMMPNDKQFEILAKNDGLTTADMGSWFITKKFTGFSGQILSWNPDIKY